MGARQIAQAQISNSYAHESVHFVTDRVKHSANLLIDSLSQHNA
jgi:ppGpp synthetase/RelA/SpoT-type nucleotidyltranferase